MKIVMFFVTMLWASTTWSYTVSGNTYVTNGSQSDVQAACAAAPDNGSVTVQIPNGTYSWSSKLSITKSLRLCGQSAGGVTIQNNLAAGNMISATSSAAGNINIYWLKVVQVANNSGGAGYALGVDRTEPSKYTVLIHDCSFDCSQVFNYSVFCSANGIIFWNDIFIGQGQNGLGGIQFVCEKYGYAGWNTPDTFGTLDTTGLSNSYVENCTFKAGIFVCNFDDNSRVVFRYNTMQDAALGSHGQESSPYGSRQWEVYNNTFTLTNGNPDNLQDWFTVRGGTGVITGNSMAGIPFKSGIQLNVYSISRGMNDGAGGTFCPLAYPAPRQTGWGWSANSNAEFGIGDDTNAGRLLGASSPGVFGPDGVGAVLDPVYIWNNTGAVTTNPGYVQTQTLTPDNCGHSEQIATFLKQGRDYYVNVAKPNWQAYTYPHPLHSEFNVGGGTQSSGWETSLYNEMQNIGTRQSKIDAVKSWLSSNPPSQAGGWETAFFNELQALKINESKISSLESWVASNPPN